VLPCATGLFYQPVDRQINSTAFSMQTKSVYPPHKQAVEAADAKASDSNGVLTCDDGNANIGVYQGNPVHGFSATRESRSYFHGQRDLPPSEY